MPKNKKTGTQAPEVVSSPKAPRQWQNKVLTYLQWKFDNYYFVAAFLIIFFALVVKFPSLGTRAEFWAESATNFFNNALNASFSQNLQTVDASYLPLIPRLISLVLVKGLHLYNTFPVVAGLLGFAFVAYFAAFITAKPFRSIIPSDIVRFVLALSFGLIADYENYTFNNFAYFGVYFVFLMIFVNKERLSKLELVSSIVLTALLFCSKGYFLVFLPVYALLFYRAWLKQAKQTIQFYLYTGIFGVLQLIVTIINLSKWTGASTAHTSFAHKISLTLFSFIRTVATILFGSNTTVTGKLPLLLVCIIIAGIGYLIYRLWRSDTGGEVARFLGIAFLLLIISLGLNVLSIADVNTSAVSYKVYETLPLIRWYTFSFFFVLVSLVAVLSYYIKDQKVLLVVVLIIGSRFSLLSFAGYQENFSGEAFSSQVSFSQWQYYAPLLNDPDYCIPVNPNPWVLTKNCAELSNNGFITHATSSVKLSQVLPLAEIGTPSIRAIVLNHPADLPNDTPVIIEALKNSQVIGQSTELTPTENKWLYFLFKDKVSPDELRFFDSRMNPISFTPILHFYGSGSKGSNVETVSGANLPSSPLIPTTSVVQAFVAHDSNLSSIAVQLATYQRINTGHLSAVLKDSSGKVLLNKTFNMSDIEDNMYFVMSLDSVIPGSRGQVYQLTLSSVDGTPSNSISVWEGAAQPEGNILTVNGQVQPGLGMSYKLYYN